MYRNAQLEEPCIEILKKSYYPGTFFCEANVYVTYQNIVHIKLKELANLNYSYEIHHKK